MVRPRTRSSLWAMLAGIAAVAFAAGVGELAAAIVAPGSSPFVVVGSALIDLAPAWAKETAIALFGTADKIALLVGIGLVLLLIAGLAGVLEVRRPPLGRVVIAVIGLAGVAAAMTRANAGTLSLVPSGLAAIAGITALLLLVRRLPVELAPEPSAPARVEEPALPAVPASAPAQAAPAPAANAPAPTSPAAAGQLDRRRFLGWAGAATAIGVLAALGGSAMQAGARAATAVRDALKLPAPRSRAVVPAGADFGIDGVAPVITPNADFYRIDTALAVPAIDPADWSLRIHGLVEREVTITWDELLALPLDESITTLTCVSNEVGGSLIGNAVWLGYPIRELLARAAPTAGADMVLSTSIDGFTASTPIEALTDDRNSILAVGMNGEPLPAEHGFPVRMVVPGLYGYVSATKWVVDLEVTRFSDTTAYWTDRGWGELGPVKISSRIDVPRRGQPVTAGTVTVAGVAWHQHVGIAAVDVQVDDGEWQPAELANPISADTWVQWRFDWAADAGEHRLRVRATGTDGEVQTSKRAAVVPDGATGLDERSITVG
ncbi:molybdopterin-dependent oxidoreductase [Agromyces atrinae]|uniref:DMSO/TMAO reductase YedYZ molybdopterin-dependent catalytic subunit n=2 Tax=Agromyces atrinae TaxID=592376 RepID=A0A852SIN9_9MICO|nr:molybdopterin-dependent oxidoreductase [Agromyces atrinae]NYD68335.1 DMSO/TMAO reductase YedYZ molybdopterin-dependent catalytic subunit [Agromyces atrinae]